MSSTVPTPALHPSQWLIDEELALAYFEFQQRNPTMLLAVTPSNAMLILGVIKIFIQSPHCPQRSRDQLCKFAAEVQSLFDKDADLEQLTRMTLQEILDIRNSKQGQAVRLEPK